MNPKLIYSADRPPQLRKWRWRCLLIPLAFILLHILLQLLAFQGVALLRGITNPLELQEQIQRPDLVNLVLVLSSLVAIPIYGLFIYLMQRRRQPGYSLGRGKPLGYASALPFGLSALLLASLVIYLWQQLSSSSAFVKNMLDSYEQHVSYLNEVNLFSMLLGAGILVPLAEELLFRGIVQSELEACLRPSLSILFGTLIFALIHFEPVQVSYVLVAGLFLSCLRHWSKSLWPSVLAHITINILGGVIPAVYKGERISQALALINLLSLPLSLVLGYLLWRRYQQEQRVLAQRSEQLYGDRLLEEEASQRPSPGAQY